ncbi:hypothetical protein IAU60_006752 [Kwoniella sp. DSM 27419]
MPRALSLVSLFGALVVLGAAQACWYYTYLENPYDYYYRYCSVGCAKMDQSDTNFKQCCLPMTSGQTTPAVCSSLASGAVPTGGTTTGSCTWGHGVPTTDQPSPTASFPTSYVPPPYKPSTGNAGTASTETQVVWVTSTTTPVCTTSSWSQTPSTTPPCTTTSTWSSESTWTPSETTDNAAASTTTSSSFWTSPAETPTASANTPSPCVCPTNEGAAPPEGFQGDNRRRGLYPRETSPCECPTTPAQTTTEAAAPTTTTPCTTTEAPMPTTDVPCECTSAAAVPTTNEGATPDSSFVPDNRRRGLLIRGECACSNEGNTPPPPRRAISARNTPPSDFVGDKRGTPPPVPVQTTSTTWVTASTCTSGTENGQTASAGVSTTPAAPPAISISVTLATTSPWSSSAATPSEEGAAPPADATGIDTRKRRYRRW